MAFCKSFYFHSGEYEEKIVETAAPPSCHLHQDATLHFQSPFDPFRLLLVAQYDERLLVHPVFSGGVSAARSHHGRPLNDDQREPLHDS